MKIAIVGAGSMGSLFGALLAKGGEDVILLDVNEERIQAIKASGLTVTDATKIRRLKVRATINPSELRGADLLIFFTKSYDLASAAKSVKPVLGRDTAVLLLLNGLGNVEVAGGILGSDRVLAGATRHGSMFIEPSKIIHTGEGGTVIGELNNKMTTRLKRIVKVFNKCGIEAKPTKNTLGTLWSKFLVNLALNPISALTGLRNKDIVKQAELMNLVSMICDEGVMVAKTLGIRLDFGDPLEDFREVALGTARNRTSMLLDVEKDSRTEIDSLNGYISRLSKELNIPTPINDSLTALVKGLEASAE